MDGSLPLIDGFIACPGRFLWHAASRTAIVADVHLGAEAEMATLGLYLPDTSSPAILRAWRQMMQADPARVVIAGDLFDAPSPSRAAVTLFNELLAILPETCNVTITPGNHDPDPAALAVLYNCPRVTLKPATVVGGYAVFHGHQSANACALQERDDQGLAGDSRKFWIPKGLIVGHQHPAVTLATRVASVKMICFAAGKVTITTPSGPERPWTIPFIILPAFSPLPLGSNLLNERNWILDFPRPNDRDIRIAGVVARGDSARILDFGILSELGK